MKIPKAFIIHWSWRTVAESSFWIEARPVLTIDQIMASVMTPKPIPVTASVRLDMIRIASKLIPGAIVPVIVPKNNEKKKIDITPTKDFCFSLSGYDGNLARSMQTELKL